MYLQGRNTGAGDGCETAKLKSAAIGQLRTVTATTEHAGSCRSGIE